MTTPAAVPPGWYQDPAGGRRWWDGTRWGDAVAGTPGIAQWTGGALVPQSLPPAPVMQPNGLPPHHAHQMPPVVLVATLKQSSTAYLLVVFLGGFGAHRFYLGRPGSAIAMLLLFQVAAWTSMLGVGIVLGFAAVIWWFVDLCTIPSMVEEENRSLFAMHAWGPRPY